MKYNELIISFPKHHLLDCISFNMYFLSKYVLMIECTAHTDEQFCSFFPQCLPLSLVSFTFPIVKPSSVILSFFLLSKKIYQNNSLILQVPSRERHTQIHAVWAFLYHSRKTTGGFFKVLEKKNSAIQ